MTRGHSPEAPHHKTSGPRSTSVICQSWGGRSDLAFADAEVGEGDEPAAVAVLAFAWMVLKAPSRALLTTPDMILL